MPALSITELDAPPDDFLPDEPEGAGFHKAFLASGISGFECRYLAISRAGVRIAIVPFFLGTFSLGTLLPDGLLKRALSVIKFSYACVGHPSTDFGAIDGEVSAEVLSLVNAMLAQKAQLIAYKGFHYTLPQEGFTRLRGLPVATLDINGDYYSTLDGHRRNDFRHKLETASVLRFEEYDTLPEPLTGPVYRLYLDTLTHAAVRFEILTPEYFRAMAGLGKFHLYFEGERLIGFLQMLTKGKKANLKYIGMDHLRNRPYYLYFAMCLRGIEAALSAGCSHIELGVSSYQAKHLMGCNLTETCLYYRHGNAQIHWLLGRLDFLLKPKMAQLR